MSGMKTKVSELFKKESKGEGESKYERSTAVDPRFGCIVTHGLIKNIGTQRTNLLEVMFVQRFA
jgi:hypothetical protein